MDTRGDISLDLVFTNNEELIEDITVVGTLDGRDHDMVLIQHLNHHLPLGPMVFAGPSLSHLSTVEIVSLK